MTKENERNINDAGTEVQEAFHKYLRVCFANTDSPIQVYPMVMMLINKLMQFALSVMHQLAVSIIDETEGKEGGAE